MTWPLEKCDWPLDHANMTKCEAKSWQYWDLDLKPVWAAWPGFTLRSESCSGSKERCNLTLYRDVAPQVNCICAHLSTMSSETKQHQRRVIAVDHIGMKQWCSTFSPGQPWLAMPGPSMGQIQLVLPMQCLRRHSRHHLAMWAGGRERELDLSPWRGKGV